MLTSTHLAQALAFALVICAVGAAPHAQSSDAMKDPVGYAQWKENVAMTSRRYVSPIPGSPVLAANNSLVPLLIPFVNDGSWSSLSRNDDGSTGIIPLGFNFTFYGETFDEACVNNNGNLSFEGCFSQYSATGFPSTSFQMIAPFWGDVDTRCANCGLTYYKQTMYNGGPVFVIHYEAVGYFASQSDKLNTFQAVIAPTATLPGGNNVCFGYGDMNWTTGSASGGTDGFGGVPATVGSNKGDGTSFFQYGRYDRPGMVYDGPGGNADGIDGLDGLSICFNTGVGSTNIPPVVSNAPAGDINVNVGDPVSFSVSFIAPESAQSTILSTGSLPGWLTCTLADGAPGGVATATCSGTAPAPGTTPVVITATDNGSPPLQTQRTVNIVVAGQNVDTSAPVCGSITFDMTGNGSVVSSATDPESGIASVRFTLLSNLQGFIDGAGPYGVGTTQALSGAPNTIELRGTRIDPTLGRAGLLAVVTNGAGLTAVCDPILATLSTSSSKTELSQNAPNPVRDRTSIPFSVAEASHVRLAIYDALGREISVLVDENMSVGSYSVSWNAADEFGRALTPGTYIVRMVAGTVVQAQRLTVVR